jgi:hypothetical protein
MNDHADDNTNLKDDDFVVLVYEYLDGSLDALGRVRFRNYLKNPDYVSQFAAICHQEQVLHELLLVGIGQQTELRDWSSVSDCELWRQMAAYERQAPAVDIEPAEPACEPLIRVHRKPLERNINMRLQVTTLISLAACLCMIIYVYLVPRYVEEQVASVTDSLGIEMAGQELAAGDRLTNRRKPFWLHKGVLEIEFLYGARVVIEGPAQFRLESAEKLRLDAGRAYAKVPGSARGFVIGTPNSTIIDLGTEFGVQVDIDGTSTVHMLKGQATLIPGVKGNKGESQLLTRGQARQVDSSGDVQDIPVRQDVFVRGFSSANEMIWRGGAVISIVQLPASGTDAATGIRPDKTYTHLLDFGGGTPATINGVAFTQIDHPEIRQDRFEDAKNRFQLQKNGGYGAFKHTSRKQTRCGVVFGRRHTGSAGRLYVSWRQ